MTALAPTSRALVLGDAVVLLLFAAGGIAFHETPGAWLAELFRISCPFFVGYYLSAHLVGALRPEPKGRVFAARTMKAWLAGITLGVLLRTVIQGRPPIARFLVVTYLFTGTLLAVWRAAYFARVRRP